MIPVLAGFGKVDDARPGYIKQLVFVSPEEISSAIDIVRDAMKNDTIIENGLRLADTVHAVDVALFGRMLADASETLRMTAAADVAHPFSVGKAIVEADFYVAIDDRAVTANEAASSFLGDAFFTSGLFYGYACVNMDQLTRNLDGDRELAAQAAAAFVEAIPTVSPAGKRAAFGTHAKAPWMMVERGTGQPTSLAAAFLRPVTSDDHLATATERAKSLAKGFDRAYGTKWERRIMERHRRQGFAR